ncbi:hypothetical protein GCM10011611_34770 [Aliidongia dinghuensis]|uniref:Uncharacterized protein n=1 Tax=Aliidongia dinghuensis TaxID=1867774 RepID=A0A8J2YVT6_9PROT|nr:hypothetical protein GCM10011611_34770 [Aliidongia dinghuensis]
MLDDRLLLAAELGIAEDVAQEILRALMGGRIGLGSGEERHDRSGHCHPGRGKSSPVAGCGNRYVCRYSRAGGNPVLTRGSADMSLVAADAALAGFPPARE